MTKTRIVVDTNIFVSAFLGSVNAKRLLKDVFNGKYQLIMTLEQLREIKLVFNRQKFRKYISLEQVEDLIELLSLIISMPIVYEKIKDCRDPKDNMILEAAVYGDVKYIITGDEDLLVMHPYRWIHIIKLNDFLNLQIGDL